MREEITKEKEEKKTKFEFIFTTLLASSLILNIILELVQRNHPWKQNDNVDLKLTFCCQIFSFLDYNLLSQAINLKKTSTCKTYEWIRVRNLPLKQLKETIVVGFHLIVMRFYSGGWNALSTERLRLTHIGSSSEKFKSTKNVQVKPVNIIKTSEKFTNSNFFFYNKKCLLAYSLPWIDWLMCITAFSSSLASSTSGSDVTEEVLGLYQEICRTRPLNFAPWLAA